MFVLEEGAQLRHPLSRVRCRETFDQTTRQIAQEGRKFGVGQVIISPAPLPP